MSMPFRQLSIPSEPCFMRFSQQLPVAISERIRKMKRLALFLIVCGIASYASAAVPVTAGLQLQLEADSLGLNNGDTVSTWTDLSGGDHTAVNTGGSPTYVANGLNGHAYVSIKGSLSADGYSWTGNN